MRRIALGVTVLSTLACGGAEPMEPLPWPPELPADRAAAPAPTAAPAGLHAVWFRDGDDEEALSCWSPGASPKRCDGAPPCTETDCWSATLLSVAPYGLGPVMIGVGSGTLGQSAPDVCTWTEVRRAEGSQPWPHQREARPAELPAALADALGAGARSDLVALDLDGDGADEVLFTAQTATGGVVGLVTPAGEVRILADDRREPLPEGASEQAREEHAAEATQTTLVGLTDAGLDGVIDVVLRAEGYESAWKVVMSPSGEELGRSGCAL